MSVRVPSINYMIISGRTTADAVLSHTEGGTPYLKFGLASNRSYQDKLGEWRQNTTFVNATLWGKSAERLSDKIRKGKPLIVEGSLASYTREVEGKKQTNVSINAFRVQLLEKESQPQPEEQPQEEVPEEVPPSDEKEMPF